VEFYSHHDTAPDWLPNLLARAAEVWVSADSVSMIYEALSAGAHVGVLEVPARRVDRITAIAADLHARGLVMALGDAMPAQPVTLREAERIAGLILARWFSDGRAA
jgi:mitochondrial fission protein ELM1